MSDERTSADGKRDAHDFFVTAVERAQSEGQLAVTLTDTRGGRVTLHLDSASAAQLRDMLSEKLD